MAKLFTDEELKLVLASARAVWDYVGYDCLQATADDTGKDINRVTVSRSLVIELVLDAGRIEERFQRCADLSPDFYARWEALTYEQRKRVVRPAFQYARYGV